MAMMVTAAVILDPHRRNSKADDSDGKPDNHLIHVVRPLDPDPYGPPSEPPDPFRAHLDPDLETEYHPLDQEKPSVSKRPPPASGASWEYGAHGSPMSTPCTDTDPLHAATITLTVTETETETETEAGAEKTTTTTTTTTKSRKKPFDKYVPTPPIHPSRIKAPSDAGQKEVGQTDPPSPPVKQPCSTITTTICPTNTGGPNRPPCHVTTIILPYPVKDDDRDVTNMNVLKDKGRVAVIAVMAVLIVIVIILGLIWGCRRKRRQRAEGVEKVGTDVEGGGSGSKIWRVLGRKKGNGRGSGCAPGPSPSVAPEMAGRNQRLSIILPPGSRRNHPHHLSNNNSLNRTLSAASSLTVPPYSRTSSTVRSNSTRTAHSLDSNITDDTVVRAKRDYQNTVSRIAVENMHSDHAVVADGFHCAPPNPFDDGDGLGVAGVGGMGGSGVGVGGLGEVDGQGNRRLVVPPDVRVTPAVNPFEDPAIEDEDVFVADGFRPQEVSIAHRPAAPPRRPLLPPALENPFEDGVGDYADVDVGMGDGFQGYVPGQMMCRHSGSVGGVGNSQRLSMRGGDADASRSRRMSADELSLGSSSSTSRQSLSSNETLRGDLDWGGSTTG